MKYEQLRERLIGLVGDLQTEAKTAYKVASLDVITAVATANGKLAVAGRILAILSDPDASDAEKGSEGARA